MVLTGEIDLHTAPRLVRGRRRRARGGPRPGRPRHARRDVLRLAGPGHARHPRARGGPRQGRARPREPRRLPQTPPRRLRHRRALRHPRTRARKPPRPRTRASATSRRPAPTAARATAAPARRPRQEPSAMNLSTTAARRSSPPPASSRSAASRSPGSAWPAKPAAVLIAGTLLLFAGGATVLAWAIVEGAGARAAAVGLAAAILPAPILVGTFLWLGRYRRRPWLVLAFCFGWGACVSTAHLPRRQHRRGGPAREERLDQNLAAVVSAPVIEEITKLLGPLLVYWFARRHLTGTLDALVYCGLAGAGFARRRERPLRLRRLPVRRRVPRRRRRDRTGHAARSSCAASPPCSPTRS